MTRVSKSRVSNSPEICSVVGKAKDGLQGASLALNTSSQHSRQVGPNTKRVLTDGLPATFPKGDFKAANLEALPPQGEILGGNSHPMKIESAKVFVLDKHKKPLDPCHPARAKELLDKGKAVVALLIPFTVRLKDRVGGNVHPITVKLDPGSKVTGIAVTREAEEGTHALWLGELEHRGDLIHKKLGQRAGYRRRRRSANLRYRVARFNNRRKPKGWLAPSLMHRVVTTVNWVNKLRKLCPITSIAMELVKFDLQKMENPEISGVEYQQGTLAGYEVKEYLLERFGRKCVYCGKENVPLETEHIIAKACGGSNKVSNLTLVCHECNQKKGKLSIEEFLAKKPEVLARIKRQLKAPMKDAAAVNSTRWVLKQALEATRLPVTTASGGKTKFNRKQFGVPKGHALDALCVGDVKAVFNWKVPVLAIKATGRGRYQRTLVNASGFSRGYLTRSKSAFGYQTGDIVKAIVTKGKNKGVWVGRVAIRARGHFNIQTSEKTISSISHKNCHLLMHANGHNYTSIKYKWSSSCIL